MGVLRRAHEWAADKGWSQYPEPEWRRRRRPQRNWVDDVFKWGLFVVLMWWIWAPVLLVLLVGAVLLFAA